MPTQSEVYPMVGGDRCVGVLAAVDSEAVDLYQYDMRMLVMTSTTARRCFLR